VFCIARCLRHEFRRWLGLLHGAGRSCRDRRVSPVADQESRARASFSRIHAQQCTGWRHFHRRHHRSTARVVIPVKRATALASNRRTQVMVGANTLAKGVFPCFEAGLLDDAGKAVNAEISAVAWDGKRLVMASDKPIPGSGRSAVFALECSRDGHPQPQTLTYYTAPLVKSAQNYEDFALIVSGDHI